MQMLVTHRYKSNWVQCRMSLNTGLIHIGNLTMELRLTQTNKLFLCCFHHFLCLVHCQWPHFHSRLCVLQEQADMLSSGVQVAGHFPVGSASSCRGLVIRVEIGSYVNLVKLPVPCVQGGNPKHLGQLTGICWDQGLHEGKPDHALVKCISILIFSNSLLLYFKLNTAVTQQLSLFILNYFAFVRKRDSGMRTVKVNQLWLMLVQTLFMQMACFADGEFMINCI